jgi:molybdopterin synthase sulfur carrier subunit
MTGVQTEVSVTVRYFAAARAAAGAEDEVLTLPSATSVAALVSELGKRNAELFRVLQRCSYLCDGIAVRDPAILLGSGQTLDVLPPFAGG